MSKSVLQRCNLRREWTIEELAVLFDEHVTGLDFEGLASKFAVPIEEIWHQLAHLFFDRCLPESEPLAPKNRQRWSPEEDAELDRLYLNNVNPADISQRLGRSVRAVCVRLLLQARIDISAERIEALGLNPDEY